MYLIHNFILLGTHCVFNFIYNLFYNIVSLIFNWLYSVQSQEERAAEIHKIAEAAVNLSTQAYDIAKDAINRQKNIRYYSLHSSSSFT